MPAITIALAVLAIAALMAGRFHGLLLVLQREGYATAGLLRWVRAEPSRLDLRSAFAVLIVGAVLGWLAETDNVAGLLGAVVVLALATLRATYQWRRDTDEPLIFTPRAVRVFVVAMVVAIVPPAVGGAIGGDADGVLAAIVLCVALYIGAPWVLALANLGARP